MHLEEIDFPSDPDGQCGDLYKSLVRTLQRASESEDMQALLGRVLFFANKQLKAAKDDFKHAGRLREAKAVKLAKEEAAAVKALQEKRYGVVDAEIEVLAKEKEDLTGILFPKDK